MIRALVLAAALLAAPAYALEQVGYDPSDPEGALRTSIQILHAVASEMGGCQERLACVRDEVLGIQPVISACSTQGSGSVVIKGAAVPASRVYQFEVLTGYDLGRLDRSCFVRF